jgi:hypothetical protein
VLVDFNRFEPEDGVFALRILLLLLLFWINRYLFPLLWGIAPLIFFAVSVLESSRMNGGFVNVNLGLLFDAFVRWVSIVSSLLHMCDIWALCQSAFHPKC